MIHSEKVVQAMEDGNMTVLEEEIKQAISEDPIEYLYALQEVLYQEGYIEAAQKVITAILEKEPSFNELKVTLAEIAIEEDQLEEAFELLDSIPEDSDAYVPALLLFADLYQMIGFSEVSAQKLLLAKEKSDDVLIDIALGEFYFHEQQYKEAYLYYLEALEKNQDDPHIAGISLWSRIGECNLEMDRAEVAIPYLVKAVKDQPEWYTVELLASAYVAIDENEKALRCLQYLEEQDGLSAASSFLYAQLLLTEQRLEEAKAMAEKSLEYDPLKSSTYHLAADIAYRLNEPKEAEDLLLKAMEVSEYENTDTTALALATLYVKEGRSDEALDVLQRLSEVDGYAHWLFAQSYREEEEYEKAMEHYEQAKEEMGHDPEFLKDYGFMLQEEGRLEEAIHYLEHYLEHEPTDFEVEDWLEANQLEN